LTDFGINDNFVKGIAEAIPRGGAALFVLAGKMTTHEVLEGLKEVGGRVLHTSFDKTVVEAIRAALATRSRNKRRRELAAAANERPNLRWDRLPILTREIRAWNLLVRVKLSARYAAPVFRWQGTDRELQALRLFFQTDPS
jgi:Protein of unknown function (DUF1269)